MRRVPELRRKSHDRRPRDAPQDIPRRGSQDRTVHDENVKSGRLADATVDIEHQGLIRTCRFCFDLGQHKVEIVEALDLGVEHITGRPAHRDGFDAQAVRCIPIDVRPRQDHKICYTPGGIHQRRPIRSTRAYPLDIGVIEFTTLKQLENQILQLPASDGQLHRDGSHGTEEAIDMGVKLEHTLVPGHRRVKNTIAIQERMIHDRNAGLALRHENVVDVNNGLSHDTFPLRLQKSN